jgi:hypothetical protein
MALAFFKLEPITYLTVKRQWENFALSASAFWRLSRGRLTLAWRRDATMTDVETGALQSSSLA